MYHFMWCDRTGRAVRYMLDRDEDISMTGQRHPYLARYKVCACFRDIMNVTGGGGGEGQNSVRRGYQKLHWICRVAITLLSCL